MDSNQIYKLFKELIKQKKHKFPQRRKRLEAPTKHGVYIIRKKHSVLHVGMSQRGNEGLNQRLKNHLYGQSSFVKKYLKQGSKLRKTGYAFQFLVVPNDKRRAYLEALTTGKLCPKHIGTGQAN